MCAVGVVTTRRQPQSGRISALAGREGRLRACTPERKAISPAATTKHSYNIRHLKRCITPAAGRGGAPLFSGGSRRCCSRCARTLVFAGVNFDVVTKYGRCPGPAACGGRCFMGVIPLPTGRGMNRFVIYMKVLKVFYMNYKAGV